MKAGGFHCHLRYCPLSFILLLLCLFFAAIVPAPSIPSCKLWSAFTSSYKVPRSGTSFSPFSLLSTHAYNRKKQFCKAYRRSISAPNEHNTTFNLRTGSDLRTTATSSRHNSHIHTAYPSINSIAMAGFLTQAAALALLANSAVAHMSKYSMIFPSQVCESGFANLIS